MYQRYLEAHGHPQEERVVLNTSNSTPLFRQIPDSSLKATFLAEINSVFSAAEDGGQILLTVNGYGSNEGDSFGGVEIDVGGAAPTYLRPSDVFCLIPADRNLNITIIINSCFSGKWVEVATDMGISGQIILITRCDTDSEILAFPEDATRRTCGGYFGKFLVNEFYREYGYHFPRPPIFQGVTGDGREIYHSCFPGTNLPHYISFGISPTAYFAAYRRRLNYIIYVRSPLVIISIANSTDFSERYNSAFIPGHRCVGRTGYPFKVGRNYPSRPCPAANTANWKAI